MGLGFRVQNIRAGVQQPHDIIFTCVRVRVCVRVCVCVCGSGKALVSINGAKPPKNIRVKRDNIAIVREPMSSTTKAELDAK